MTVLLVLFLCCFACSSFAYEFSFETRRILPSLSVDEAYARCIRGWRRDNLGLILPPSLVTQSGDEESGVGLVLLRIPPFLQEGIVASNQTDTARSLTYKVLNPSWITWPVQDHQGVIEFRPDALGGTEFVWTVSWTPLDFPLVPGLWNRLLETVTQVIISIAASYVARGDPGHEEAGILSTVRQLVETSTTTRSNDQRT